MIYFSIFAAEVNKAQGLKVSEDGGIFKVSDTSGLY